jgi:hypothetical protein
MKNEINIDEEEYNFINAIGRNDTFKNLFDGARVLGFRILKTLEIHVSRNQLSAIVLARTFGREEEDAEKIIIYGVSNNLKCEPMPDLLCDYGSNIYARIVVAFECDNFLEP